LTEPPGFQLERQANERVRVASLGREVNLHRFRAFFRLLSAKSRKDDGLQIRMFVETGLNGDMSIY
jgi:hypothetical protein